LRRSQQGLQSIHAKLGIENRMDVMRHKDHIQFYLEHF
jgi:hypothetical protein